MILTPPSTLRFASALTRQADAQAAADELIRSIREQLGASRIDLAFLFISAQHANQADTLSHAIRAALGPDTLVEARNRGYTLATPGATRRRRKPRA